MLETLIGIAAASAFYYFVLWSISIQRALRGIQATLRRLVDLEIDRWRNEQPYLSQRAEKRREDAA